MLLTKQDVLSNQKCMVNLPLLIYIIMNTVKNVTTIHFAVKLDRCAGGCNTINDLSNKG